MEGYSVRVVTLSGLPGTGTSTAAKRLMKATGFQYVNTGAIFREMAAERGMSLEEFGRLVSLDPKVDRELDDRQLAYIRRPDQIVEGRLAGWVRHENQVPGLSVWLEAPLEVRAGRVSGRDLQSLEQAKKAILEREATERNRYLEFYGYDLFDTSIYDLVLDSHELTPGPIVERILDAMKKRTP